MKYSPELVSELLELIASGKTLSSALNALKEKNGVSVERQTVFVWQERDKEFEANFAKAAAMGIQARVDACHDLIDDPHSDIFRTKLKTHFTQWEAERRLPALYGNRLDVNVTNKLDLSSVLNPAEHRLMLSRRTAENVIDAEIVDSTPKKIESVSGSKPVESPQVIDPLGILE